MHKKMKTMTMAIEPKPTSSSSSSLNFLQKTVLYKRRNNNLSDKVELYEITETTTLVDTYYTIYTKLVSCTFLRIFLCA